jgi:hypothetical protein
LEKSFQKPENIHIGMVRIRSYMNSVARVPLNTSPEQFARLQALQSAFAEVCNALAPEVQRTRLQCHLCGFAHFSHGVSNACQPV